MVASDLRISEFDPAQADIRARLRGTPIEYFSTLFSLKVMDHTNSQYPQFGHYRSKILIFFQCAVENLTLENESVQTIFPGGHCRFQLLSEMKGQVIQGLSINDVTFEGGGKPKSDQK